MKPGCADPATFIVTNPCGNPKLLLDERNGLIWSDRVNLSNPGVFVVVVFVVVRGQSEQQSGQFSATIDQSDIRGSEPHNLDPSGAASDRYRESG